MAIGTSVGAQNIATANASALIVQDLSIVKDQDLDFGIVKPSSGPTVVLLDPITGTTTISTGLGTLLDTGGANSVTPAQFTVTGTGLAIFTITLPGSVTLTNTDDGVSTMEVNGFLANLPLVGVTLGGILGDLGITETFNVGALLNVGANQAPGLYTGTFDVQVNYL